jgi:hypothetical protein
MEAGGRLGVGGRAAPEGDGGIVGRVGHPSHTTVRPGER